jgi:hypothetical protein
MHTGLLWRNMKERGSLKDNIESYPKEMGWVSMDWINVAQGKDKWAVSCEQCNEPLVFTKCWHI